MVEKFTKILESIEERKGRVTLFAILKMDEFLDRWTVVFCAPWSTNENRDEIFEMIRKEIMKTLSPEETGEIASIAMYAKTDHLVAELIKFQSGTTFENRKINGNKVHYAQIIKSDPSV